MGRPRKTPKTTSTVPQSTTSSNVSLGENGLINNNNPENDNLSSNINNNNNYVTNDIKNANSLKNNLVLYKGEDDKITIENWFIRFEMICKFDNIRDSDKVFILGNYLSDSALDWYINLVNGNDNITFEEIKKGIISRFGFQTINPLVEFVRLNYDTNLGMENYFNQKRKLASLSGLTETQSVILMIEGLPFNLKNCFIAVQPTTYTEFLSIAKVAENNLLKNFFPKIQNNSNNNYSSFHPKFKTNKRFRGNNLFGYNNNNNNNRSNYSVDNNKFKFVRKETEKKLPPNPCRICEKKGHMNQFHWVWDCKNRDQTNKAINIIESSSKTSANRLN